MIKKHLNQDQASLAIHRIYSRKACRIIVFCGPKGAGKDMAAKRVINSATAKGWSVSQINFADKLKDITANLFDLPIEYCNNQDLKEQVLCDVYDTHPAHQRSPRRILQRLGQCLRNEFPHIWAQAWLNTVLNSVHEQSNSDIILVSDMRYRDEYEILRMLNAEIYYIQRTEVEKLREQGIDSGDPAWMHESESQTPYFKAVLPNISNNGSLNDLFAAVDDAVWK